MTSMSLIPIDTNLYPELARLRELKYQRALAYLITGKVNASDFANIGIKELSSRGYPIRTVRGGNKYEYLPGWWFQEQLTALFSGMWSFVILERNIDLETSQVWVSGELQITLANEQMIRRPGTGGAEIDRYQSDVHAKDRSGCEIPAIVVHKAGSIIDLADDIKSAETEALSRAARWLGFGADIYNRREV